MDGTENGRLQQLYNRVVAMFTLRSNNRGTSRSKDGKDKVGDKGSQDDWRVSEKHSSGTHTA